MCVFQTYVVLAREKILSSLNHLFPSMMLRNRKRQKLAKMKAEEEERKKPKVIPHWKRAAMEALRQEREKIEKANEEKDNREEEADEVVEDSEEKPAYFNDFLAQAKRLDSSLKSSFDLDQPVQRQSLEGEDEVEVGEEIERRSLMRERMMRYKEDKYKDTMMRYKEDKDKDKDTMMRYKVKESQPQTNPYEVLPGYSRNTLGSSISKSKSMSMNVSNMSNLSNMSISMNLSLHQLGMANSRSMVLSQPVVLSPH